MEDIAILEPKSIEVDIKDHNGNTVKTVTLHEMPAARVEKFYRYLSKLDTEDFEKDNLKDIYSEKTKLVVKFISWLLNDPEIDADFINKYITPSMAEKLVSLQNSLNELDEILKKAVIRLAGRRKN